MAANTSRLARRSFLDGVELFSGLTASQLDHLVEFSATRSLATTDILCHKGDEAGQLYGVPNGRLKAVGAGAEVTEAALDALCLDCIARFKRPRVYRFVDALPKNNYGKVLKTALRDLLV